VTSLRDRAIAAANQAGADWHRNTYGDLVDTQVDAVLAVVREELVAIAVENEDGFTDSVSARFLRRVADRIAPAPRAEETT
jgi:hypothetical protein